jgi:hypothetical protein
MTIFDQRGQEVKYQYNAAGDINFGSVVNRADLVPEMRKLLAEVNKAAQAGVLSKELTSDVGTTIEKAVNEAQKPNADNKTILKRLNEAKSLIEGVASATGLVTGLTQAVEAVRRLFQ